MIYNGFLISQLNFEHIKISLCYMLLWIIWLIVYESYNLRIQNMLSNSQYLKMLLMFTFDLLSHYMVIAFCTLF
jgi:hypothetical protein